MPEGTAPHRAPHRAAAAAWHFIAIWHTVCSWHMAVVPTKIYIRQYIGKFMRDTGARHAPAIVKGCRGRGGKGREVFKGATSPRGSERFTGGAVGGEEGGGGAGRHSGLRTGRAGCATVAVRVLSMPHVLICPLRPPLGSDSLAC